MPYHVSLSTVAAQQRYEVVVVDELDGITARNLADWLDAARLNPGARFRVDLTEASWVDARALRRLLSRHESLRAEGRLELIGHQPRAMPARMALAPGAAIAAEALLSGCL
jgi:anti-anti-sigma regulatory factor